MTVDKIVQGEAAEFGERGDGQSGIVTDLEDNLAFLAERVAPIFEQELYEGEKGPHPELQRVLPLLPKLVTLSYASWGEEKKVYVQMNKVCKKEIMGFIVEDYGEDIKSTGILSLVRLDIDGDIDYKRLAVIVPEMEILRRLEQLKMSCYDNPYQAAIMEHGVDDKGFITGVLRMVNPSYTGQVRRDNMLCKPLGFEDFMAYARKTGQVSEVGKRFKRYMHLDSR